MTGTRSVAPLALTEQAMLDQASQATATIAVGDVGVTAGVLSAKVTISSLTGHKFPSGVGFRRAFVEFSVLDREWRYAVGVGPHQRRRRDRRRARHAVGGRAVVEGRLLGLAQSRRAAAPAALPGDQRPGPGADLPGAGVDAAGSPPGADLQCGRCAAGRRADDELPVDLLPR